jgi:ABC-type nitrate/sulfonate/bicarbonate transport system permease component
VNQMTSPPDHTLTNTRAASRPWTPTGGTSQEFDKSSVMSSLKTPLVRQKLLLIRICSVVVTLVAWEIYGRSVNPIFLSYPTAILAALPQMITSGELPRALAGSLGPFALGWAAAIAIGVVLGLLMGRYAVVDAVFDAQMMALYSTPTVALIPLFILWLGIGFSAKVAILFLSAFFPIALSAYGGAKSLTSDLTDIGRVENAREDQIFLKIVVPASVPFVMTGIRLSVGRAVVGMVVAEMFTAIGGLGGSIVLYSSTYKTDRLFVVIAVLSAIGVLLSEVTKRIENHFLKRRI